MRAEPPEADSMLKRVLAAALLATAIPAHATAFSTDYSDLWYNPNESGWGVNVIQQDNTLFATLFVYSSTGSAAWYVASALTSTNGTTFTGPLYQTTGPYFGASTFNPSQVNTRLVGTATFSFASPLAATLAYSVDGVTVNKSINRQTWRTENVAGTFIGGTVGTYSGCSSNGYFEEIALLSIAQTGSSITMVHAGTGASCTYTGSYSQAGRMGSIEGSLACANGASGSFTMTEVHVTQSGMTAKGTLNLGGSCRWSGRFGGLRRGA